MDYLKHQIEELRTIIQILQKTRVINGLTAYILSKHTDDIQEAATRIDYQENSR